MNVIKRAINSIRYRLNYKKNKRKEKRIFKRKMQPKLKVSRDTVYHVLTPTHVNIGDHAITVAVQNMLKDCNLPFVEITFDELYQLKKYDLLGAMNEHTIFINGGGNLGTLWPMVENIMRDVVSSNKNSRIIILPNTIYYEDTEHGRSELQKSKKIYNAHKHLKFYAREMISYDFMKQHYNDVELCPDVALSLNETKPATKRSGCLLCLRNDLEKTLSEENFSLLLSQVKSVFKDNFTISDMYAESPVGVDDRQVELTKKLDEFRKSELVITDRLHGMLFATITSTPCIVVNSLSPKVKGCFEWIKDLGYVKFCNDLTTLNETYFEIKNRSYNFSNEYLSNYFEKLKETIKRYAKN